MKILKRYDLDSDHWDEFHIGEVEDGMYYDKDEVDNLLAAEREKVQRLREFVSNELACCCNLKEYVCLRCIVLKETE